VWRAAGDADALPSCGCCSCLLLLHLQTKYGYKKEETYGSYKPKY
jgi:hypothetical protein